MASPSPVPLMKELSFTNRPAYHIVNVISQ